MVVSATATATTAAAAADDDDDDDDLHYNNNDNNPTTPKFTVVELYPNIRIIIILLSLLAMTCVYLDDNDDGTGSENGILGVIVIIIVISISMSMSMSINIVIKSHNE